MTIWLNIEVPKFLVPFEFKKTLGGNELYKIGKNIMKSTKKSRKGTKKYFRRFPQTQSYQGFQRLVPKNIYFTYCC